MSTFIGYTCGFNTTHPTQKRPVLAKAEYNRREDGAVVITAASGHNLSRINSFGSAVITTEQFQNRPHDPYDSLAEAEWALGLLGAEIAGR